MHRDSPCASARCLQVTKVVGLKRDLLERGRASAAAAAVAERPIHAHVCGRQRDRHRALRGCRAACMRHAAEGQQRRMFGLQPCLPVLGLGSLTQLSSRASLEQQRSLQGALARVAPLHRRIAAGTQCGKKITNSR